MSAQKEKNLSLLRKKYVELAAESETQINFELTINNEVQLKILDNAIYNCKYCDCGFCHTGNAFIHADYCRTGHSESYCPVGYDYITGLYEHEKEPVITIFCDEDDDKLSEAIKEFTREGKLRGDKTGRVAVNRNAETVKGAHSHSHLINRDIDPGRKYELHSSKPRTVSFQMGTQQIDRIVQDLLENKKRNISVGYSVKGSRSDEGEVEWEANTVQLSELDAPDSIVNSNVIQKYFEKVLRESEKRKPFMLDVSDGNNSPSTKPFNPGGGNVYADDDVKLAAELYIKQLKKDSNEKTLRVDDDEKDCTQVRSEWRTHVKNYHGGYDLQPHVGLIDDDEFDEGSGKLVETSPERVNRLSIFIDSLPAWQEGSREQTLKKLEEAIEDEFNEGNGKLAEIATGSQGNQGPSCTASIDDYPSKIEIKDLIEAKKIIEGNNAAYELKKLAASFHEMLKNSQLSPIENKFSTRIGRFSCSRPVNENKELELDPDWHKNVTLTNKVPTLDELHGNDILKYIGTTEEKYVEQPEVLIGIDYGEMESRTVACLIQDGMILKLPEGFSVEDEYVKATARIFAKHREDLDAQLIADASIALPPAGMKAVEAFHREEKEKLKKLKLAKAYNMSGEDIQKMFSEQIDEAGKLPEHFNCRSDIVEFPDGFKTVGDILKETAENNFQSQEETVMVTKEDVLKEMEGSRYLCDFATTSFSLAVDVLLNDGSIEIPTGSREAFKKLAYEDYEVYNIDNCLFGGDKKYTFFIQNLKDIIENNPIMQISKEWVASAKQ